MSPRKDNTLTIVGWSDPKKGKLYKGKVKKADVNKKSKYLRVTIENLDPNQLGRIHEITLPLPVRPGNQTCAFLTACGIDADAVGTRISLEDITGATVGMRFSAPGQDGSQHVDFETIEDSSQTHPESPVEEPGDQAGRRVSDPEKQDLSNI